MASSRRTTSSTRPTPGVSLSRGPALALGSVLLVAGLFFLYRESNFTHFSNFPNGHARIGGKAFLGIFGVNGWSGELTAAAGGLLLFGAAQHLLAKTMSLIVGVALAGVAIIALADHHSALGLFAANVWTMVLWGASGALLLINSLLPRSGGSEGPVVESTRAVPASAPVAAAAPVMAAPVYQRPVAPVQPVAPAAVGHEPVTTVHEPAAAVNEPVTTVHEPAATVDEPVSTVNEPATTVNEPATADSAPVTAPIEPVTGTYGETDAPVTATQHADAGRPVGAGVRSDLDTDEA